MWKYLFFKVYLDLKDPLSFSGPEHFAFSQMKDKQTFIKLIPIRNSLSLNLKKTNLDGQVVTIKDLHNAIQNIQKTHDLILQKITENDNNQTNIDD